MTPFVTIEVSPSAVRHNLRLFRARIGPNVKLGAAVKSDGYGHGLDLLVDAIAAESDWLCVACPSEAIRLRRLGYSGPILSFFSACGYDEKNRDEAIEELVTAGVTQTIVDASEIPMIAGIARRLGKTADVHIHINTGMHRSGLPPEATAACVARIRDEAGLKLGGIYTHFATADEADKSCTVAQFERFLKTVTGCDVGRDVILHAANSVALIDLPEMHLDMVRPGISVYGYQPSMVMQTKLPLRPALRVTCPLLQVRKAPAGASCGYGLTYTFNKPGLIGRVPIGYGDGYLRCLSNQSSVRVRGQDAPVRGRVSMDQLIIDLTEIPEARAGDEVEIISPDSSAPHSVENLALLADTIPHEITSRLGGPRVRRIAVP